MKLTYKNERQMYYKLNYSWYCLSWLCQVGKKYCRSTYQKVDASTISIWVVEGNETIAHKLVATMDTHLHMNGDPMEWSSMGNNEVVVD